MGMWSDASKGEESPWKKHPNAKESGRGERISEAVGGWTGSERRRRRNEGVTEYADMINGMASAPGGRTPAPAKKMSGPQRRAADRILKEGKQPKGKK